MRAFVNCVCSCFTCICITVVVVLFITGKDTKYTRRLYVIRKLIRQYLCVKLMYKYTEYAQAYQRMHTHTHSRKHKTCNSIDTCSVFYVNGNYTQICGPTIFHPSFTTYFFFTKYDLSIIFVVFQVQIYMKSQ